MNKLRSLAFGVTQNLIASCSTFGRITGFLSVSAGTRFASVGACHGYSEKIYRRALAIVLQERGFDVIEERHIKVIFHGINIGTFYVDLVVNGKIVVEIKAAQRSGSTGRSCRTVAGSTVLVCVGLCSSVAG
jgi:hypothetical protein